MIARVIRRVWRYFCRMDVASVLFAVLLQGLPVSPREWWDDHWIGDRLRLKLGDALPAAE